MSISGRDETSTREQQRDCPLNPPSTSKADMLSTCSSCSDSGIQIDGSIEQSLEKRKNRKNNQKEKIAKKIKNFSLSASPTLVDWMETENFGEKEPLIVAMPSTTSIKGHERDFPVHESPQKRQDDPSRLDGSRFSLASHHSAATSSSSQFLCRICHLNKNSRKDPLISPCRCSGSMLYVHKSCLVHWLELSTRKMVPSPRCELCGYFYRRTAMLTVRRVHAPHVDVSDRLLNGLFLFVVLIMMICASMALHFLQQQHYTTTLRGYRVVSSRLSQEDLIVIGSSILFFVAFFVAIFTQYRAEASIFRICFRFWVINRNWTIRDYRPEEDEARLGERATRGNEQPSQVIVHSPKRPPKQ